MVDTTMTPVVVTPRSHLKRKHGEIVDLVADDESTSGMSGTAPSNGKQRRLEDDDLGGEEGSIFEDALDEIELNPYVPGQLFSFT